MDTNIEFRCFKYYKNIRAWALNDVMRGSYSYKTPDGRSVNVTRGFHDITVCLKGELHYIINKTKDIVLKEQDILYMPPDTKRIRFASEGDTTYASVNFFSDSVKYFDNNHFVRYNDQNVMAVIDLMDSALKKNNIDKLNFLIEYLLSDIAEKNEFSCGNEHVNEMKRYISDHINDKITVDEIANHVYLSRIYCESLFKKNVGEPIVSYINSKKISYGKTLLKDTEYTVAQISEALGFSDCNYFSRVFKKYSGMSPNAYRKMI